MKISKHRIDKIVSTPRANRARKELSEAPYYVLAPWSDIWGGWDPVIKNPELGLLSGYPCTFLCDTLEYARKKAACRSSLLYSLNGQLNDMEARIFEKGGKHIETYKSGLPEAEYNMIKEEKEKEDENKPETKSVISFSWK
jgi:hypothetical protein